MNSTNSKKTPIRWHCNKKLPSTFTLQSTEYLHSLRLFAAFRLFRKITSVYTLFNCLRVNTTSKERQRHIITMNKPDQNRAKHWIHIKQNIQIIKRLELPVLCLACYSSLSALPEHSKAAQRSFPKPAERGELVPSLPRVTTPHLGS